MTTICYDFNWRIRHYGFSVEPVKWLAIRYRDYSMPGFEFDNVVFGIADVTAADCLVGTQGIYGAGEEPPGGVQYDTAVAVVLVRDGNHPE